MDENLSTSEKKEFLTQKITKLENELEVLIAEETKKSNEFKEKWQLLAKQVGRDFTESNVENVHALVNQLKSENKIFTFFVNRPSLFSDKVFDKNYAEIRNALNTTGVPIEHIENDLKNGNKTTNYLLKSYKADAVKQDKYWKMTEEIAAIKKQLDTNLDSSQSKMLAMSISDTGFIKNKNSSEIIEDNINNNKTMENKDSNITSEDKISSSTVVENLFSVMEVTQSHDSTLENLLPVTEVTQSHDSTLENLLPVIEVTQSHDSTLANLLPVTEVTETICSYNHKQKIQQVNLSLVQHKNKTIMTKDIIQSSLLHNNNVVNISKVEKVDTTPVPFNTIVNNHEATLFIVNEHQTHNTEEVTNVLQPKQPPTSTEMNWDLFVKTDNIPLTLSAPTNTTFEDFHFLQYQNHEAKVVENDVSTVEVAKNDNANASAFATHHARAIAI